MPEQRQYDIVLLGATGFTGALTAHYLATHAPQTTRWALAGRNREKLAQLRDRLTEANPACADLGLLEADVSDPSSMRALATCTRVAASTVGPYVRYGEPLVAACAQSATDYLDLTGEPEFVDRMYVRHHAAAVRSGARMVHACGFDSVPHDLGALFTVDQMPPGVPLRVRGLVRAGGSASGGTLHSAVTAFSRVRQTAQASGERRRLEPRPDGRRVSSLPPLAGYERELGAWTLPMPTIDPQIVKRSARALERYGPDFAYGHFLAVKRLPAALALAGGVAGTFALAQLGPTRSLLLGRIAAGDGPSPERREKGWFRVRFVAEGGGRRAVTEVSGGDPGYDETSKMLAESALCLAHDELPPTAGQVTTAQAMGDRLIGRLQSQGMGFEVLEAA